MLASIDGVALVTLEIFDEVRILFSNIANLLLVGLVLLCWILIIKRVIGNKFAPVKSVKAEVFDKYTTSAVSRIHGTFRREHNVVVFSTSEKKLSFQVSKFSYETYNIKDKGILTYKGDQMISFK